MSEESGKQIRKAGRRLRTSLPAEGGSRGRRGVASKRVATAPMGTGVVVGVEALQV